MRIRVLGPVEVGYGDTIVSVQGRKQRAVLAGLAAAKGHVVNVDALVTYVWGDEPPDGAEHSLQQHVLTLRKLFTAIGHPDASAVLVRRGSGYCLAEVSIDSERFETAAADGFTAASGNRWSQACNSFDAALAEWRGDAFGDARETFRLNSAAVRLDAIRLSVIEARFDALLASGRSAEIVPLLEAVVEEHPLRESFRRQLMLALYRSGRQADALAAYQAARRVLVEELGIEPNAELRRLEQAILRQSPELDAAAAGAQNDLFATFRAGLLEQPARLELPDGQAVFLRDGTNLIGRDPTAAVRLVDSRVSRRHAEVVGSARTWSVRDLGSTNGTLVNGQRVDDVVLADHDLIDVGGIGLMFRTSEGT